MNIIPLLRHHIDRAASGVAYNALAHCHSESLYSIVLHDDPGNRVRLFYADYGHRLECNRSDRFSLAIHPHHCALRFIGLFGPARNDVYAITPNANGEFQEMAYQSTIIAGEGSLTPTGRRADVHRLISEALTSNPELQAHQLHTIYSPNSQRSAWLVIEGLESDSYESLCWTNDPSPDLSGLYVPMDSEKVRYTLTEIVQQTERAA